MTPPFATLAELLASHFHPEWRRTADSAEAVLTALVRESTPEVLRRALFDLDELLGRGLCEPQLRDLVLYELDCHVAPEQEGVDMSAWLYRVREVMSRSG